MSFKEFELNHQTYKLSKPLFWIFALITFSLAFYVFYQDSFSGNVHGYSSCPNSSVGGCFNMFYNSSVCNDGTIPKEDKLCTVEHMFAGEELGVKPDWFTSNFYMIIFFSGLILLIINHFLYNKDFSFKVEVN